MAGRLRRTIGLTLTGQGGQGEPRPPRPHLPAPSQALAFTVSGKPRRSAAGPSAAAEPVADESELHQPYGERADGERPIGERTARDRGTAVQRRRLLGDPVLGRLPGCGARVGHPQPRGAGDSRARNGRRSRSSTARAIRMVARRRPSRSPTAGARRADEHPRAPILSPSPPSRACRGLRHRPAQHGRRTGLRHDDRRRQRAGDRRHARHTVRAGGAADRRRRRRQLGRRDAQHGRRDRGLPGDALGRRERVRSAGSDAEPLVHGPRRPVRDLHVHGGRRSTTPGPPPPAPPPSTVVAAPAITASPSNPSVAASPSFSFSGGGGFQCQLDAGAFQSCSSPRRTPDWPTGSTRSRSTRRTAPTTAPMRATPGRSTAPRRRSPLSPPTRAPAGQPRSRFRRPARPTLSSARSTARLLDMLESEQLQRPERRLAQLPGRGGERRWRHHDGHRRHLVDRRHAADRRDRELHRRLSEDGVGQRQLHRRLGQRDRRELELGKAPTSVGDAVGRQLRRILELLADWSDAPGLAVPRQHGPQRQLLPLPIPRLRRRRQSGHLHRFEHRRDRYRSPGPRTGRFGLGQRLRERQRDLLQRQRRRVLPPLRRAD